MHRSARETLLAYLAAQSEGVDAVMALVADDAVFDVGRGSYAGRQAIRDFHERLRAVNSRTTVLALQDVSPSAASAVFEQRDDDLGPLGVDSIRLNVRVETTGDERITRFTARPTPESLEALSAARQAGRTSDGLQLAERAGTLPGADDEGVSHSRPL